MLKIFILLLLALSLGANERSIFLMGPSYHTPSDYDGATNNITYGLGYEYTGSYGIGVQGGAYKNSYSDNSVFLGVHIEKEIVENLKWNISISGATGYEIMPVRPIALVGMQYYFIRIVTSYPISELAGGGSLFNLQLVYDF